MPAVEVSEQMSAPRDVVWDLINDVESHPQLMDHVESCEVVERGIDYRVTAWVVDLKGCVMRWLEREEIDHERRRIEYRQVKGDMDRFQGHWQVDPLADGGCRVTLSVDFDIGIPQLAEMLGPIAENAIRNSATSMLAALAAHSRVPG
jgi:ribosome-associated toxin RatA of RatAB toxin-antitoxin module